MLPIPENSGAKMSDTYKYVNAVQFIVNTIPFGCVIAVPFKVNTKPFGYVIIAVQFKVNTIPFGCHLLLTKHRVSCFHEQQKNEINFLRNLLFQVIVCLFSPRCPISDINKKNSYDAAINIK